MGPAILAQPVHPPPSAANTNSATEGSTIEDKYHLLKRALAYLDEGINISKVIQLLTSPGLYQPESAESFASDLAAGYPEPANPAPLDPTLLIGSPASFDEATVAQIIKEKDLTTSAGLEAVHMIDFRSAAKNFPGFTKNLTALLLHIVNDRVEHPELRQRLIDTRGVPLVKANSKLRAIAVGNLLISLAGSALARASKPTVLATFGSLNLGLASSGIEKALWSIKFGQLIDKDNVVLQMDISNAFNSVSRHAMLDILHSRGFKTLVSYFSLRYGSATRIFFRHGTQTITAYSKEGVVPGDPMGPIFFHIAMSHYMDELRGMFKNVIAPSVHDDVHLVGSADQVTAFYVYLRGKRDEEAGHILDVEAEAAKLGDITSELGLRLNPLKCRVWRATALSNEDALKFSSLQIQIVPASEGLVVLGSAIGSDHFIKSFLQSSVDNIGKVGRDLGDLYTMATTGGHWAIAAGIYRAVQLVLGAMFNHHTRQLDPAMVHPFAVMVENIQLEVIGKIAGFDVATLSPTSRTRLLLPWRLGGMGLTATASIANVAYVAGFQAVEMYIRDEIYGGNNTAFLKGKADVPGLSGAFQQVNDQVIAGKSPLFTDPPPVEARGLQKRYADAVHQKRCDDMLESLSVKDQLIYKESIGKGYSSAWAKGPLTDLQHRLSNGVFKDTFQLRAGLDLRGHEHIVDGHCPLGCTVAEDEVKHHPVTCPELHKGNRHSRMAEAIKLAFVDLSANKVSAPAKEPFTTHLKRKSNQISRESEEVVPEVGEEEGKCRGDCVLNGESGTLAFVDFCFGSRSKSDSAKSTKTAQLEKTKRYEYRHFELDNKFVAFAGDTYGAIGAEAVALIERLIPPEARETSSNTMTKRQQFYWRYSCALMKANSIMVTTYSSRCYSAKLAAVRAQYLASKPGTVNNNNNNNINNTGIPTTSVPSSSPTTSEPTTAALTTVEN